MIGAIGMDVSSEMPSRGHWLGTPFRGLRTASETARAGAEFCFAQAGIGALTFGAFEGNAASLRLQEKLGFRLTGWRVRRCEALDPHLVHKDTALPRAHREARA